MKILFLSEWYPSEKDKMAGLFVQKHAQAVAAQGCEVRVNQFWTKADVVQLNVLSFKKGLQALALKTFFGIPYIIVEHWSYYLPQNGAYLRQKRWRRFLLEKIAHFSSGIFPVSNMLAAAMKNCGIENSHWGKIDNVVNDFFYNAEPISRNSKIKNLLYIGCFDEKSKNVKSLLRAVKKVSEIRQDFVLTLVGTGNDFEECFSFAKTLNFPPEILRFTGELAPEEVCQEMRKSDFFVLSSRYENAPVVISECLAFGLPIVTTKAGGTVEMMSDETGVMVEVEDDEALAKQIEFMLDNFQNFDRNLIRQHGEKFRFETVGKKLVEIYKNVKK